MRRRWRGGKPYGWGLALCAIGACSGALRVPQEPPVSATACTLLQAPSIVADTTTITFDALGATREQCALTLAAEGLRPWPLASSEPWTVHLTLTPTEALVRRLDRERARNAIDAGSPLLATEDPDLTAYAATRADLEVSPLPWDRTYLRLSPRSGASLGGAAGPDAVRADARPADAPPCEVPPTTLELDAVSSARVVYDGSDRTARELAERTVALVERSDATAVGLTAAELDVALHAGNELAYVISVPRASYCDALLALAQRAPWMTPHSIIPLIDTRAHAIAPRAPRP